MIGSRSKESKFTKPEPVEPPSRNKKPVSLINFLNATGWSLAAIDSAAKHKIVEILYPNGRTHVRFL